MRTDAQVGGPSLGGQVGSGQLPGSGAPFNPTAFPWRIATTPDLTPRWRRVSAPTYIRGPELPQPVEPPSNRPWSIALAPERTPPWWKRTRLSSSIGPELAQPNVDPSSLGFGITDQQRWGPKIPAWRTRTRDSWVAPSTSTFNEAQVIDLINQGINHRKIGTPSLEGGTQGLLAFISGVNQSGTFAALSCNITRQLGTTGQARITFNVASGGFTPLLGSAITIQENNRTLFNGLITKRKRNIYPATTMSQWSVIAIDWNGLLSRHVIALDTPADSLLNTTARILGQPSIFYDRISIAGVDPDISVAEDFSWAYIKMSDAIGQTALSTNTIWWIDNYKVMHQILAADAPASAYSVIENGQQVDPDIAVEDSLDNYRNTQYVRASNELLSEVVTVTDSHTFTGAVGDIVCITRYPFTSAPASVLENGIEIVRSDRFFELNLDGSTVYPPGGEGWYWMASSYGIWHWPSYDYPVLGTTISTTYTGVSTYAGNVVKYQDSAEILAMQAISGGSGVYEDVEDYSGSLTYNQALALAQGIERGTAPPPQVITLGTIEIVEDIGYAVSVVLPRWGISGTYVIQQMDLTDMGADLGKGTRFHRRLQLVSVRTLGNYTQYWERLYARINKAQVPAPTEKPTWGLAYDTPGNVSDGLQRGAFGEPWAVQTGLGRILYVSIVFATAADDDIVIDIQLNGNSIFQSTAATYAPGDTGTQILYAAFNPNRVNVTRGDLITLSVQSCGTVDPGKNGTVTVVIGQR